jgi:plasmid stability protein
MHISFFGPDRPKTAWIAAGAILAMTLVIVVWRAGAFGTSTASLARSDKPEDRQAAIEALAKSRSSTATEALSALAADKNPVTAMMAVRALAEQQTPENQTVLKRIITDKQLKPAIRSEAAYNIGKFKDADPAVLTQTLASDENPDVRAGAAKGLARLEMPSTIPQLSAALEDPSPEVRRWAITAIHRMIVRRFPYDADKPPETQQDTIKRIRDYLKQCKVL